MQAGVYKKVKVSGRGKGTGLGNYYQFIGLARGHFDGDPDVVVYIPLRIEPEWAGTLRLCYINRKDFDEMFEFVGEGLPK